MALDRDVVGRIRKHRRSPFSAHEELESRGIERAGTDQPVLTKLPNVPQLTDGGAAVRFCAGRVLVHGPQR